MKEAIYIGWDPREADAFAVARSSCRRHLTRPIPIFGLVLDDLKANGLYRRPMKNLASAADRPVMWDLISDAPQSTEHANSRFLTPFLAREGWALFCDGDMLFRSNVARLFDSLDRKYAVYCVKHQHTPREGVKMDGQQQRRYDRKNWSSLVAFNASHPSNRCLTSSVDMANTLPGRDLHKFCWLKDNEIGSLDPTWNFLVGESEPVEDVKIAHFTLGLPSMAGYHDSAFASEWRDELLRWAR